MQIAWDVQVHNSAQKTVDAESHTVPQNLSEGHQPHVDAESAASGLNILSKSPLL